MMKTSSYWVIEANKGEIRDSTLKEEKDYSLVKTLLSGISTGTEKLVGKRNVPSSAYNFMSVPYMEGNFDLPIKYGYSLVGVPLSGKYKGLRTFIMHPHQSLFYASDSDLLVLPDEISNEDWVLAYNGNTFVGARQWHGSYTDIPTMGNDGLDNTVYYIEAGLTPQFK